MRLPFLTQPQLSTKITCFTNTTPDLLTKVEDLLSKQVIQELTPQQAQLQPGFYSRVFTVPKPGSQKRRFIFDLRRLNTHLQTQHVKMEKLSDALALIRQGDYMTSIDISEAYHHIPIHQDHQPYLRFALHQHHKTRIFQFKGLPMGLSVAPQLYIKTMKVPMARIRAMGIRCTIYVDDILIIASTPEQARHDTQIVWNILTEAGFLINTDKAELTPQQQLKFLGMIINTLNMTVSVPKPKLKSCRATIRQTIQQHHLNTLTIRQLATAIGQIQALHPAITETRMFLTHLQRTKSRAVQAHGWTGKTTLTTEALDELLFWQMNLQSLALSGRNWNILPPDAEIHSDASDLGWGAP